MTIGINSIRNKYRKPKQELILYIVHIINILENIDKIKKNYKADLQKYFHEPEIVFRVLRKRIIVQHYCINDKFLNKLVSKNKIIYEDRSGGSIDYRGDYNKTHGINVEHQLLLVCVSDNNNIDKISVTNRFNIYLKSNIKYSRLIHDRDVSKVNSIMKGECEIKKNVLLLLRKNP